MKRKVKAPNGDFEFVTGGNEYAIEMGMGMDPQKGRIFIIRDNDGKLIHCNERNSVWLNGLNWIML